MAIGSIISQGLMVAYFSPPVAGVCLVAVSPVAVGGGFISKEITSKVARLVLASDFGKNGCVKELLCPRELACISFVIGFVATLIPAYFALCYILDIGSVAPYDPNRKTTGQALK